MNERDLVFIGGGHTHALVLRMLAMDPIPGVRLTLISDTLHTPYSGMLPGYLAGVYTLDETHVDLNKLANAAGLRLIHDRVTGIDVTHKTISLANHADIYYDKVSINTGSTPNLTVPGAKEYSVGVKPVSRLTHVWQQLLETPQTSVPHWAVVGGGAAGVEVALAMTERFKALNRPLKLSLVFTSETVLPSYTRGVQKKATDALSKAGVNLVNRFNVVEVQQNALIGENGQQYQIDQAIWCTPAVAPTWPEAAGLNVDRNGFIAVNSYLQSTSHPDVFACGDVSAMTHSPRPKAGVFAVRSAPFLLKNLRAAFSQKPMQKTRLQRDFLSLLSLGDGNAVGQRNGFSFSGRWVWRWKDSIDRKFMALFDQKLPSMDAMDDETMHCAGCGSKLGPILLSETLNELGHGGYAEDAASVPLNQASLWQSIDGFRSFTDDLYRLGQIAVHHAVNDSYAMGLPPTSAQVWVNLSFSHPRLARRDFKFFMAGISDALNHHETKLIGGHSTEGAETHVAVVVNGEGEARWPKRGAKPGDWLLLNKPIGTGIILAADMQNQASPQSITALWQHLLTSNRSFFQTLQTKTVHAATDVTGFGLIGHLLEMMEETIGTAVIDSHAVPLINGTLNLSERGIASTLLPQLEPLRHKCEVQLRNEALLNCLLDPQTQGGLLIALPEEEAKSLLDEGQAWKIGEVIPAETYAVRII